MKVKKLLVALVATFCLVGTVFSASAAPAIVSKPAGEFGTLTGMLDDSIAQMTPYSGLMYEFSYRTEVTKSPGSCRLYARVELKNNATGAHIWSEEAPYLGGDSCGYYVELQGFNGIRGENGITVATYGSHEARYTSACVVYTVKTYNLYRDHGIK